MSNSLVEWYPVPHGITVSLAALNSRHDVRMPPTARSEHILILPGTPTLTVATFSGCVAGFMGDELGRHVTFGTTLVVTPPTMTARK